MALEIPQEDTGSIAIIKTLPRASLERLVNALESAPPISNPSEMADLIARQIVGIPADRVAPVIETLYTLYHIRELSGVRPARFIADLMEAIQRTPHPRVPQKELARLRSILEKLMTIGTLKTVAKAARLQREWERLYCEAKILSDIRPVFGADPESIPVGAVLTHTLRLGYHEGSQHKEFHVVLDSDDLMAINEVILRAQVKEKSLRNMLKRAKLPGGSVIA
jgi:hypothetical protein